MGSTCSNIHTCTDELGSCSQHQLRKGKAAAVIIQVATQITHKMHVATKTTLASCRNKKKHCTKKPTCAEGSKQKAGENRKSSQRKMVAAEKIDPKTENNIQTVFSPCKSQQSKRKMRKMVTYETTHIKRDIKIVVSEECNCLGCLDLNW